MDRKVVEKKISDAFNYYDKCRSNASILSNILDEKTRKLPEYSKWRKANALEIRAKRKYNSLQEEFMKMCPNCEFAGFVYSEDYRENERITCAVCGGRGMVFK